jgi:hypothetical protein
MLRVHIYNEAPNIVDYEEDDYNGICIESDEDADRCKCMLMIMMMMKVSAACAGVDYDDDCVNKKVKSQMRMIMRVAC